MIDFSPLCPPAEPRSRMRIVPSGNARSSEITTNCLTGDSALQFRQQARNCLSTQVHEGLRFRELRYRAFNLAAPDKRTAFATSNCDPCVLGQLVNQHETRGCDASTRNLYQGFLSQQLTLPIANFRLPICIDLQLAIGNRQLAMALLGFLAFFFLLALANHFRLGRLFALNRQQPEQPLPSRYRPWRSPDQASVRISIPSAT